MGKIQIILLLLYSIYAQNFTVSLNDSILLNQNYVNIKTIGKNFQGNFFVGFTNGEARIYTSNFSSFTSISLPQPVDIFNTRSSSLSASISNGSSVSIGDRMIVIKSNNHTTVRDIDYYTYINQESYHVNETILSQMGFPIKVHNTTYTFHVLVCTSTVYVAYRGIIMQALVYNSYFGNKLTCKYALNYQYPISTSGLNFNANFKYYLGFDNGDVYQLTCNLTLLYNFTIIHYDFDSVSFANSLIFSAPSPITYISIANGLLMMQSNSTGFIYICNMNSNTIGSVTGIPLNQTFKFFYIYSAYYILQSTGLIKLAYNTTSNSLTSNALMVSLPLNTYDLNFGPSIDPFFIPGRPYLYKGGICIGSNSYIKGSLCVSYNCTVINCSSCPIAPTMCSACNVGYVIYGQQCRIKNNSNNSNALQFYTLGFSYDWLLQDFFNILKFLISIPAARRAISPVFFYFGIFDDIYLFQFHDRIYGTTMNTVFSNINDIEKKKWSIINYTEVLGIFHINIDSFQNSTDYQDAYEYYIFTDSCHTDVGPEGLWSNCQNFFVVALPIIIFGFILLRGLFKLFYNYSISRWIRKFQFWTLLFLLLLDGNIQQFAFYQVTEWKNMFAFSFPSKLIKYQVVFFGFMMVLISIALFFLSYWFYSSLNKYIMDNHKNNVRGQFSLIVQIGLKNFFFGFMHSVLRGIPYTTMLNVLLVCEILFNVVFLTSLVHGMYKSKLKMWIYLLLNFIKVNLMITLHLDYQKINEPTIEHVQQFLILLQISIFLLGVLHQSIICIKQMFLIAKYSFQTKMVNSPPQQNQYLRNALSYKGATVFVSDMNYSPNLFLSPKQKQKNAQSQLQQARIVKKLNQSLRIKSSLSKATRRMPKLTIKIQHQQHPLYL